MPWLIFIISFGFLLSLMSRGPVTVDCLDLAIKSKTLLHTGHIEYLYGFGYPLMLVLGAAATFVAQCAGITDNVEAVNFVATLFGSASVAAFFVLVEPLTDDLTAALCSLLLLFNPIFIDVSTYGISHTPALFFLLSGLGLLVRQRPSGSALCLGLMGAVRLQDLILMSPFVILVLVWVLRRTETRAPWRRVALFVMTIAIVVALFHAPYIFCDRGPYAAQLNTFWETGLTSNFKGLFSPSLRAGFGYLTQAFSLIGLGIWAAGLFLSVRLRNVPCLLTVLWWLVPIGFYGNLVTTAPRFLTIILPAFIIPMGFFLSHLYRQRNKALQAAALVALLIMIGIPLKSTLGTFVRRHQESLIAEFYTWVGQATPPQALVICCDDRMFVSYYAGRRVIDRPERTGHLTLRELMDFKQQVDAALGSNSPVYLTGMGLTGYDFYAEFRNFMRKNYRLTLVGQRPLELWHTSPFDPRLHLSQLIRVERKPLNTLDS